jgi:opacity protein-like surface antigen
MSIRLRFRPVLPLIPLLFGLILAMTMTAKTACAQTSRLYIASYMGFNLYDKQDFHEDTTATSGHFDYKNAMSFAGALGIRLNRHVRLEGEISYRNAQIKNADSGTTLTGGGSDHAWLAMANVYYDFNLNWRNITPFVTAGIGIASHDTSINAGSGLPAADARSLGFAYQAGAGLLYRVSPTLAFTGDYKYLATTDIDTGSYRTGYHSHEIRLGIQYDLPVGFMN